MDDTGREAVIYELSRRMYQICDKRSVSCNIDRMVCAIIYLLNSITFINYSFNSQLIYTFIIRFNAFVTKKGLMLLLILTILLNFGFRACI